MSRSSPRVAPAAGPSSDRNGGPARRSDQAEAAAEGPRALLVATRERPRRSLPLAHGGDLRWRAATRSAAPHHAAVGAPPIDLRTGGRAEPAPVPAEPERPAQIIELRRELARLEEAEVAARRLADPRTRARLERRRLRRSRPRHRFRTCPRPPLSPRLAPRRRARGAAAARRPPPEPLGWRALAAAAAPPPAAPEPPEEGVVEAPLPLLLDLRGLRRPAATSSFSRAPPSSSSSAPTQHTAGARRRPSCGRGTAGAAGRRLGGARPARLAGPRRLRRLYDQECRRSSTMRPPLRLRALRVHAQGAEGALPDLPGAHPRRCAGLPCPPSADAAPTPAPTPAPTASATIAAQDEEYQTSLAIDQVADFIAAEAAAGAHADK